MQLLYIIEVGKETFVDALSGLSADPSIGEDAKTYGVQLARRVLEHQEDIDKLIGESSSNWDLERIAIVDKIIIRCAAAELLYFADVPLRVAINEAVDIARKFSTGDSSRFVNGVLDSIAKKFSNSNQRDQQDAE